MDDIKLWIWGIILVAYYIIRARNKAKKEAEDRRANQPTQGSADGGQQPERALTFEELLREIQTGRTTTAPEPQQTLPQPTTYQKPAPSPWEVDYEDEPVEEIHDLETIEPQRKASERESFEAYERAKLEAFNRPSLEETMKLADTDVNFGHFKGYDTTTTEPDVLQGYLSTLKDPEGFRKAFILSEILKRKF